MMTDLDKRVQKLADAIQHAEGYDVPGSRPQRNHNPGDLETDISGKGIGKDGPYVVYTNYTDGREALEMQCRLMLNGHSHVYLPTMTILQMAARYTATQQSEWASNVADFLKVPVDIQLEAIPV
jgi:hypothetical protein